MQISLKREIIKAIPIAFIIAIVSFFLISSSTSADEKRSFDLENLEEQSFEFIDEDGNETTIGMEPVDHSDNAISPMNLSPGTNIWRTYYAVGTLHAEFYSEITITNNIATIDRVYNPSYGGLFGTITGDTLSIVRQQQSGSLPAEANYRIEFDRPSPLGSGTAQLFLEVHGTTATTSQQGFWLP